VVPKMMGVANNLADFDNACIGNDVVKEKWSQYILLKINDI